MTVEPWWHRAVFYRLDPATFQDSKGDGHGDLAGIAQRLEYLQTLGVDALILRSTSEVNPDSTVAPTLSMDGFDDLARAAVGHHIRVLVELGAPASQSADAQYLNMARAWLNQGAAGIYVPTGALQKVDGTTHLAQLLQQLRALTDSFPGGRVLLADAPATPDEDLLTALSKETQLTASTPIGTSPDGRTMPTAESLRVQLAAALGRAPVATDAKPTTAKPAATTAPAGRVRGRARGRRRSRQRAMGSNASRGPRAPKGTSNTLLVAVRVPAEGDAKARTALERTLAAMLLDSKAAVMLEYGQELGLEMAGTREPLMQWTPSNLTRAPKPEPVAPKPQKAGPTYQGFHAYIPPLRKDFFPPPKMPVVVESDEPDVVKIDPNTLPGFTAGTLDTALAAPNGETANVAVEEQDAGSLLSLYKQLIRSHHLRR